MTRRLASALGLVGAVVTLGAAPALAEFPYTRAGGDPRDYDDLFLAPGQVPDDADGKREWMYAATAADPGTPPDPLIAAVNADPSELHGVRGAHVVDADPAAATAWQLSAGRPDVAIAVLDSGIEWDNDGAMADLRFKTRLSAGELPAPRNDGLGTANEPGEDCSGAGPYDGAGRDLNSDGAFNLLDFACDSRVEPGSANNVNPDLFEPQDLLIAFSDGSDDDGNGYADDIVGWDFVDDDNDPYDDVQYGHGTGEALDSTAEADNDGELGTCPNCMAVHMRVGDSFIADVNRFAAATIYAVDNGALVVQEALGTLNNSSLSREAVAYAYRHGVAVIASAADEAAQHNNWPSTLPHVILVNSVTMYEQFADPPAPFPNPFTEEPKSYLKFNGCTNFNAKISIAIPSVSCSSDATGRAAGMAGLIYSAALNAIERGKLDPHPDCLLAVDGPDPGSGRDPCPLTANEVRQLIASGALDPTLATIADKDPIADDVDFAAKPEASCSPVPAPGCTDGNLNTPYTNVAAATLAPSKRYPARADHDQFYGWGRVNMAASLEALLPTGDSLLPPEVEITAPRWFDQVDPHRAMLRIAGEVFARGNEYVCAVYVAPGHYPNNRLTTESPPGDFAPVPSDHCDGSTRRTGSFAGPLADLELAELRSRFPADAGSFDGPEPGAGAGQTSNGRPNSAPYGFTVKVVAWTDGYSAELTGEDRRALYLHRDRDMLPGFPLKLPSDGESSPAFADLDGDNRNELIFATTDGFVHALAYDRAAGTLAELPGWPVRGDPPGFVTAHAGARGYAGGHVSTDLGGPFLASVAIGDSDRNGLPEVYAADLEGRIYGWSRRGRLVFEAAANPDYSGRPLTPFVNERLGPRNRTQGGFIGSPVLADLDRNDGGKLELIAAAMDRHVYAFDHDGSPLPGFPVLVVDPSKVASVDPASHQVRFGDGGEELNQGAINHPPAVSDVSGDSRPEIIVGTNEEYAIKDGTEGEHNIAPSDAVAYSLLSATDLLDPANGRVYVIKPGGDPDGPAAGQTPFATGWPRPIAIALAELLPIIGEGINGAPVVARLTCPAGGEGPKIGLMPAAGPAYVLNANGSSCFGQEDGKHRVLSSEISTSAGKTDSPVIPAVGLPAFGDLGAAQPSFLGPVAGAIRAADLGLNEYQLGGQDFIAAWDTATGEFAPGYPSQVNDLQFLTGPSIADIGGSGAEEVLAGSASMDLAAFRADGGTVAGWPKLSTDWTVASPLVGTLGTRDHRGGSRKVVVGLTRSGYVNAYATGAAACTAASWPRFRHDVANSGDYSRDAVAPGRPFAVSVDERAGELRFRAPGDDLLCGSANRLELATSSRPIDERSFDAARPLPGAPEPAAAGAVQAYRLPASARRYVALRARDEQGNLGMVAAVEVEAGNSDGGDGGDGGRGDSGRGEGGEGGRGDGDGDGSPVSGTGDGDGILPFTGLPLAALIALGLLLLALGLVARSHRRGGPAL